jgi:hypothetical protein
VLEGRTAVRAGCISAEGVHLEDPTAHALADADYFTACMKAASPAMRYACMMDGLMGEGTVLPMCPE